MAKQSTKTETEKSTPPERYIPYLMAMKLLAERLRATPEEMAAWIMMGPKQRLIEMRNATHEENTPWYRRPSPEEMAELDRLDRMGKDCGLAAYLNANEFVDPPLKFHYSFGSGNENDFDYLSPLMACWFLEDDITRFDPAERYITGKALIERWRVQQHIKTEALTEAFIRAKITESRLTDAHPICGLTQGSNPQNPTSPPMASALFALSDVKAIEVEDSLEPMPAQVSVNTVALADNSDREAGAPERGNPATRLVETEARTMEERGERVTPSAMWAHLGGLVGKSIIEDTKSDAYLVNVGETDYYKLTKGAVRGILNRRKKRMATARQQHGPHG